MVGNEERSNVTDFGLEDMPDILQFFEINRFDKFSRVSMDYAFCTFWRILTHSGAF